ncbi:SDR family NAD(P)-dependent oxidoreductase [Actinopolymorpha singaporensis]|uniref:Glucose 1-dehydrogenase n=1 Tax=Actinopolymorpha singaporensis TaxID=117157 RepID=A0A1H1R9A5_9ACTN|nr:SDR family oxidoreductase [Actinopolymorpha singaporensis]SDS32301.1 glucose 1-dehydrogenase [Actinopolymorpha singaporensis]
MAESPSSGGAPTGDSPTVAVVTGAGGGIGGACARALAGSHDTVICVDRDPDRAQETVAAIEQAGGSAVPLAADAAEPAFGEHVAAVAAAAGLVRSAVHALAHEEHVPALDLSLDSVRLSFAIGPLAAFALFRALAVAPTPPPPGAAFTVIGSLHEKHAFARCLGYNAAHGALGQVVRTLAHEWADRRIRVNAVVPGWVATPGEVALYGEEHLARAGKALPFGAMGDVGQVAAAVAFLSSPAAGYISGSFLTVDGALSVSLARLPEGDQS